MKEKLLNIPGYHTTRRIVVIESDDWGSIRMPSREAFSQMQQSGIDLVSGDSLRYNRYDTLAGKVDFDALFEVLRRHRDKTGRPAVFTALSLVANPDFHRIKESSFQEYYYEPITKTIARYHPDDDVFACWRRGIDEGLFHPQFHGREHLNVAVWLRDLRAGNEQAHTAFAQQCWGFNNTHRYNVSYQAAFDVEHPDDLPLQAQILGDGLKLFGQLFGYQATFFVPPNGMLHEVHYELLQSRDIKYLFSSRMHHVPVGGGRYKRRLNYLGKRNGAGQRFIIRNAFFEPSQEGKDWVEACLGDIARAFRHRRPAIIGTHRVNFVGGLEETNRDRGLQQLDRLLGRILQTWKNVEFMTSTELGRIIDGDHVDH